MWDPCRVDSTLPQGQKVRNRNIRVHIIWVRMKPEARHGKPEPPTATTTEPAENPMFAVFDLIGAIERRAQRIVADTLGESGLTPDQYLVLASLRGKDGRPLREIADALRCSPSTVTGIADTMEKKGLVSREANPEDRRSVLLCLTAKGKALRASTPNLEAFYAGCAVGMSRQEFERLRVMLMKLQECLKAATGAS